MPSRALTGSYAIECADLAGRLAEATKAEVDLQIGDRLDEA
jgi:hypothetical protein